MNAVVKELKYRNKRNLKATTDKSYAVFSCFDNGFRVNYINKIPVKGFVMEVKSGYVTIPYEIRTNYNIQPVVTVDIMGKDSMFVRAELKDGCEIPKPFCGVSYIDTSELDFDGLDYVSETKTNTGYRLYTSTLLPRDWKARTITIHAGKAARIEVCETIRKDYYNYPTLRQVKDVYGERMQDFVGERFTFIQEVTNAVEYNNLPTPKNFRLLSDMKKGMSFDCYTGYRTRKSAADRKIYVFAPKPVKCAFNDETIDPVVETHETVTLCDDCKEDVQDFGALLAQVNTIKEMLRTLTERYLVCKNEKETLEVENRLLRELVKGGIQ